MYGTNPEDAGTGTLHACLLGIFFKRKFLHLLYKMGTLMQDIFCILFYKVSAIYVQISGDLL